MPRDKKKKDTDDSEDVLKFIRRKEREKLEDGFFVEALDLGKTTETNGETQTDPPEIQSGKYNFKVVDPAIGQQDSLPDARDSQPITPEQTQGAESEVPPVPPPKFSPPEPSTFESEVPPVPPPKFSAPGPFKAPKLPAPTVAAGTPVKTALPPGLITPDTPPAPAPRPFKAPKLPAPTVAAGTPVKTAPPPGLITPDTPPAPAPGPFKAPKLPAPTVAAGTPVKTAPPPDMISPTSPGNDSPPPLVFKPPPTDIFDVGEELAGFDSAAEESHASSTPTINDNDQKGLPSESIPTVAEKTKKMTHEDQEALINELISKKEGCIPKEFMPTQPTDDLDKSDSDLWFVVAKMFQHLALELNYDSEMLFEYLERYEEPKKKSHPLAEIEKAIKKYIKNMAKEYYNPKDLQRIPEIMREFCCWSGSYREFVDFISEMKHLKQVVDERTCN